jgi:agmatine deiminase
MTRRREQFLHVPPITAISTTSTVERFTMPAEWIPHRATWVAWPHNRSDWPGKLGAVEWCYVELVRQLTVTEPVAVVFSGGVQERRALGRLSRAGVDLDRVERYCLPTDRSWIRDSGGTFVTRQDGPVSGDEVALVDWRFNAWAKYDDWSRDNALPTGIAAVRGLNRMTPCWPGGGAIVLEGGSVDVNGAGALLTTEECLLDQMVQSRNPGFGREDVEVALHDYLGVDTVIWLGGGIEGDDTHGHVDDIARFVAEDVVVAAIETDQSDANYIPLADNLVRLRRVRWRGRQLTVVPIPMPRPLWFGTQRLPASYLNFYVANGRVLVPTFNDPADRVALNRLAELFPDREVVGVHAIDLVMGLGTLHCATLQEPASNAISHGSRSLQAH